MLYPLFIAIFFGEIKTSFIRIDQFFRVFLSYCPSTHVEPIANLNFLLTTLTWHMRDLARTVVSMVVLVGSQPGTQEKSDDHFIHQHDTMKNSSPWQTTDSVCRVSWSSAWCSIASAHGSVAALRATRRRGGAAGLLPVILVVTRVWRHVKPEKKKKTDLL